MNSVVGQCNIVAPDGDGFCTGVLEVEGTNRRVLENADFHSLLVVFIQAYDVGQKRNVFFYAATDYSLLTKAKMIIDAGEPLPVSHFLSVITFGFDGLDLFREAITETYGFDEKTPNLYLMLE